MFLNTYNQQICEFHLIFLLHNVLTVKKGNKLISWPTIKRTKVTFLLEIPM